MKVILYNIGKTDSGYLEKGINDYFNRIVHFLDFSVIDLPAIKQSKNLSPDMYKQKEADIFNKILKKGDIVILLDENGIEHNSRAFANWLGKLMNAGGRQYVFLTGGAYGFSKELYDRADYKIALSKLTFTHQLVRLVFVEQLYRACTLLKGIPYHND